jgi:hypothetical protein
MSAPPTPDTDAAMALGMASTAMPFARSPVEQAERWLRILRLHGQAGVALQALGVSEAPMEALAAASAAAEEPGPGQGAARDVVTAVTERAVAVAADRGARTVGTSEVLVAMMDVYGEDFDRVLRQHGTDRSEVLERLGP